MLGCFTSAFDDATRTKRVGFVMLLRTLSPTAGVSFEQSPVDHDGRPSVATYAYVLARRIANGLHTSKQAKRGAYTHREPGLPSYENSQAAHDASMHESDATGAPLFASISLHVREREVLSAPISGTL